jgi:hypothetical protein
LLEHTINLAKQNIYLFYKLNKHTLVLADPDFVSSLNTGIIASRNLINNSSLGSPS